MIAAPGAEIVTLEYCARHRPIISGRRKMAMRNVLFTTLVLTAACFAAPAHAVTLYVASNGNDGGLCTQTAPCATVQRAVFNAGVNDTVFCVDGVGGGSLYITKSVDIDCSGARAILRDSNVGGASIYISIPVNAGDPLRTARLRGISIIGPSLVLRGIDILSAAVVSIENLVVSDAQQQGIFDERTGGQTKLFITDSIIRNNGGTGIAIGSQGPTTIVLDNVRSENNSYGIAVASGNNVSISRSVFSGNSVAGVEGDTGAQVIVDQSTISHNNIGVQSDSSVRLSNSNVAFNNTAVSGGTGSFGNNRLSGNATTGTNLIPLGGASSDVAQK